MKLTPPHEFSEAPPLSSKSQTVSLLPPPPGAIKGGMQTLGARDDVLHEYLGFGRPDRCRARHRAMGGGVEFLLREPHGGGE